ncbi:MAG: Coenzyme F420 hydrogenase/dehydrogenase, beta subunit C-terminal domain [Planctomycetes bacterium]|nr:Coenzyme F420 hydrogenase/dehydrogenase, beta subunit C-terminal domain [Planctomycetota bacterium]MCB9911077.1 Coenzyme F420 hydrogenase/dehydrogenase, beta subunit C-terminal domain [Planctomycetota bacterium]MCB9912179.1 Coenzyme F420 hydrogenase/dehydrogenase, beta subunit C-terminal domain [Planctomycetota bacterium]
MVDDLDQGRRPVVQPGAGVGASFEACPGKGLELPPFDPASGHLRELWEGWGGVLELWEGYASDDAIRFAGSSGGAATALSLFALEARGSSGVLHAGARKDVPYLNETQFSQSRSDLMRNTGSRYAPASPCDGLAQLEAAPKPSVFVGKPCDVAGLKRAQAVRPGLESKVEVSIAIFCAGAPSTRGTLEMARQMGVEDPARIESVRYRGQGWPGHAEVHGTDSHDQPVGGKLSYAASWGDILQKFRPWRCYVCADHTGEFADLSVGDPWYREIPADEPGRSLILVRTEKGRAFLQAAREAGVLTLEPVPAHILPDSQRNLLHTRGAVFGRVWACRMLGVAAPSFRRMGVGKTWLTQLSLKQRAQAFYGTFKRVFTKKLYARRPVVPMPEARTQKELGE